VRTSGATATGVEAPWPELLTLRRAPHAQVFPKQHGPYSLRLNPAVPVWTNSAVGAAALPDTPFPGCDTMYSTFQFAVSKNGGRPAVGVRPLLKARQRPAICAATPPSSARPGTPPLASGRGSALLRLPAIHTGRM
jgi:hypothetical protein